MASNSDADPALRRIAAFVAIAVLHVHFLWGIAARLSGKAHYQFFPILLLGFGILVYLRLQKAVWLKSPALSVRVIVYGLFGLTCYMLGTWFQSYWIGTLSCIVLCWAAAWYFGGPVIAERLRGPVAMLFLVMPLPLELDRNLIVSLQKTATQSASQLLDKLQVPHTTSGVAIRTVNREFMVEDACSGIHSLFSGVTAMVAFAVVSRYSFTRVVLTVAQTVFWVLLANTGRVFAVVYGAVRFELELDSGWRHDALSLLTYFSALVMALSTDQLFRFIVRHDASQPGLISHLLESPIKGINELVDGLKVKGAMASRLPIAAGGLFLCPLFLLGMSAIVSRDTSEGAVPAFANDAVRVVNAVFVPKEIEGWELVDTERVERKKNDILGSASVIYTFKGNGMTARFSVDGLFPDWHDLGVCYEALGWKAEGIQNLSAASEDDGETELLLYRNESEHAVCWFTCLDSRNRFVEPRAVRSNSFRNLIDRLVTENILSQPNAVALPIYQFQLVSMREGEFLPHENELLLELFRQIKNEIARDRMGSTVPGVGQGAMKRESIPIDERINVQRSQAFVLGRYESRGA